MNIRWPTHGSPDDFTEAILEAIADWYAAPPQGASHFLSVTPVCIVERALGWLDRLASSVCSEDIVEFLPLVDNGAKLSILLHDQEWLSDLFASIYTDARLRPLSQRVFSTRSLQRNGETILWTERMLRWSFPRIYRALDFPTAGLTNLPVEQLIAFKKEEVTAVLPLPNDSLTDMGRRKEVVSSKTINKTQETSLSRQLVNVDRLIASKASTKKDRLIASIDKKDTRANSRARPSRRRPVSPRILSNIRLEPLATSYCEADYFDEAYIDDYVICSNGDRFHSSNEAETPTVIAPSWTAFFTFSSRNRPADSEGDFSVTAGSKLSPSKWVPSRAIEESALQKLQMLKQCNVPYPRRLVATFNSIAPHYAGIADEEVRLGLPTSVLVELMLENPVAFFDAMFGSEKPDAGRREFLPVQIVPIVFVETIALLPEDFPIHELEAMIRRIPTRLLQSTAIVLVDKYDQSSASSQEHSSVVLQRIQCLLEVLFANHIDVEGTELEVLFRSISLMITLARLPFLRQRVLDRATELSWIVKCDLYTELPAGLLTNRRLLASIQAEYSSLVAAGDDLTLLRSYLCDERCLKCVRCAVSVDSSVFGHDPANLLVEALLIRASEWQWNVALQMVSSSTVPRDVMVRQWFAAATPAWKEQANENVCLRILRRTAEIVKCIRREAAEAMMPDSAIYAAAIDGWFNILHTCWKEEMGDDQELTITDCVRSQWWLEKRKPSLAIAGLQLVQLLSETCILQ